MLVGRAARWMACRLPIIGSGLCALRLLQPGPEPAGMSGRSPKSGVAEGNIACGMERRALGRPPASWHTEVAAEQPVVTRHVRFWVPETNLANGRLGSALERLPFEFIAAEQPLEPRRLEAASQLRVDSTHSSPSVRYKAACRRARGHRVPHLRSGPSLAPAFGQERKLTKFRSTVHSHRRQDDRMQHSRLRIDGWAINVKRPAGSVARRA